MCIRDSPTAKKHVVLGKAANIEHKVAKKQGESRVSKSGRPPDCSKVGRALQVLELIGAQFGPEAREEASEALLALDAEAQEWRDLLDQAAGIRTDGAEVGPQLAKFLAAIRKAVK